MIHALQNYNKTVYTEMSRKHFAYKQTMFLIVQVWNHLSQLKAVQCRLCVGKNVRAECFYKPLIPITSIPNLIFLRIKQGIVPFFPKGCASPWLAWFSQHVCLAWSSGWEDSLKGLLLLTDNLTTSHLQRQDDLLSGSQNITHPKKPFQNYSHSEQSHIILGSNH